MTSFLVERETINKCVRAILLHTKAGCQPGDKLGARLRKMNHRAMESKYGDSVPEDLTFEYCPKDYNQVEMYKALDCLSHQCYEGSLPDTDLYWLVEKTKRDLAREIITGLPEYQEAPWE